MREIVIVIADLYWPEGPPTERELSGASLPGLARASRFGQTARLSESWFSGLSHWLGRPDLAHLAPATAAATLTQLSLPSGDLTCAWIATPLHLLAGISSVHLDHRGVLRLTPEEVTQLVQDFAHTFEGSGFTLHALPPSELLLLGPLLPALKTVEPARVIAASLREVQPSGEGAAPLRRLHAEVEMWLHAHTVNQNRSRHGAPTISALWTWGAGPVRTPASPPTPHPQDVVFTEQAHVRGLFHLHGGGCHPVPDTLHDALRYAEASRAAVILEIGQGMQTHPRWTLIEALEDLDTRFIAPALEAVRNRTLERVVLIANDRSLTLTASHLRKWWRRTRSALSGLTS